MDEKEMVDDLVSMLDSRIMRGTGHINVNVDAFQKETRTVRTSGCTDCSGAPLSCGVPTLEEGLDDFNGETDNTDKGGTANGSK